MIRKVIGVSIVLVCVATTRWPYPMWFKCAAKMKKCKAICITTKGKKGPK